MPKFKKKPVTIDAVQYTGDEAPIKKFMGKAAEQCYTVQHKLFIKTLEGDMLATKGDWIIRGVNGEFYPCKPDVFAKTYDPA